MEKTVQMTGLWKGRAIFILHSIIALLLITWLLPTSRAIWDILDEATFIQLNKWIQNNPFWQTFWALANHRYTDWLFDIVILLFVGHYLSSAPKHLKARRLAEIIFCIGITALTIILINRGIFKYFVVYSRKSPSLTTPMATILSKVIPWISIKDSAKNSFPGDHATTAIFFIISMGILLDRKSKILAFLTGIFFILPRLIVGAHWLTDVVIGSLTIALFIISWTFYTPFFHIVVSKLEGIFRLWKKILKH
jgi:membrane-associated phospholipid phosphatase